MLTLFLLRHAKSSWSNPDLEDFDRPLNSRGQKAAMKMGAYIQAHDLNPDLILCSAAARTCETLGRILPFLNGDIEIQTLEALYHAGRPEQIRRLLTDHAIGSKRVMVIGHNPIMQDFALETCSSGDAVMLDLLNTKYPTGALAEIRFEASSWKDIAANGALIRFIQPRSL